ncbi:MAG: hypothetical protein HRT57_15430 [Crocinitomicaceae bacterium]|nr:hypothetical protein [Crocinitomicaceae bacterium]
MHHVTITDEILKSFRVKDDTGSLYNQRFHITLNGQISWQGGSVSLGNNTAYIALSKARMKELDVHLGDEVSVELKRDFSKCGFEVPEEFTEVLEQDHEGRVRFESLRMGIQRATIYLVIQIKSSDKKIEKSIFFLENLKRAPKGEETMRNVLGKYLP